MYIYIYHEIDDIPFALTFSLIFTISHLSATRIPRSRHNRGTLLRHREEAISVLSFNVKLFRFLIEIIKTIDFFLVEVHVGNIGFTDLNLFDLKTTKNKRPPSLPIPFL